MSIRSFIAAIALMSAAGQAQYVLKDDYIKDGNFWDQWSFFTDSDPTHGSVKYVDQKTASAAGLISSNNGEYYMGMDYKNAAPNGRQSVRVTSKKSYNDGLVILDLEHMPVGCGTWPAFWMVGGDWPNNGEIDIIEGVNDQSTNAMTLHTNAGCAISSSASMKGHVATPNCDVNAAGQANNQGCGISTTDTNTYGTGFNNNKGGVYATEWTDKYIKIFFFPRSSIPADITSGKPDPSKWGSPYASFEGCNFPSHFKNMNLVFDITTCGDWAGATWSSSSCASKASTCSAFVANNAGSFKDANWLIKGLQVYSSGGSSGNAPAAPAPAKSSAAPSPVVPAVTSTAAANIPAAKPTTTTQQAPAPAVTTSQQAPPPVATTIQQAPPPVATTTQQAPPPAVTTSSSAPAGKPTSQPTGEIVQEGPNGEIYIPANHSHP